MLYRLYTEDKNRETVKEIVSKYFDGYTLLSGEGVWKGNEEKSLVIEIYTLDHNAEHVIQKIADEIEIRNEQESVLVVSLPTSLPLPVLV